MRELVRFAPLPLAVFGPEGDFIMRSDAWRDLISEAGGNLNQIRAMIPAGGQIFVRSMGGVIERTPPIWLTDSDGARRCVRLRLGPWRTSDERTIGVMAYAWDATQEETGRRALERSTERLTQALVIGQMLVKELDLKTGQTFVSCPSDDLQFVADNQAVSLDYIHPDDRVRILEMAAAADLSGKPQQIEFRTNTEPMMWLRKTSQTYIDDAGAPDHVLMVTQDITEKVRRSNQVYNLAYTDTLTGLPNRARFQMAFEEAVAECAGSGSRLGLIMVDVDHFKEINDTLGHDAGDALLKALAAHLQGAFRASDIVARLGGDEFAVLLKDVMTEADLERPLRMLKAALASPIQHHAQGFSIRTSVGAALHDDPASDPVDLMKNADIALYKAKEEGRNRVVMFRPQMRVQVERRIELLRDVRAAIPRGEFTMFYQPVVSLDADAVVGLEALMRWNHPQRGVLAPGAFMDALEDQELALVLGEIALDIVVRQMRQWLDEGADFGRVAINISSAQFRTGKLTAQIAAKLAQWNVPAERLTIEVTENVYMGWGAEIVSQTVRELHAMGVSIALDDFGTGYASLANLRQFPIDRLKIDKSFVQNQADEAIVRAVINLGASLGMEVVAEGVEHPSQLDTVSKYGCDKIQGFHFARPMPAAQVADFMSGFSAAAPDLTHAA